MGRLGACWEKKACDAPDEIQPRDVSNTVCDDACGLDGVTGMNGPMNTTFKSWMLSLALLVPVAACDDDDGGDDSAGDSANDSGNEGGMTSSSEEVCQSSHSCINDVCQCDTPTLEGMECTDDDECEDECEICM